MNSKPIASPLPPAMLNYCVPPSGNGQSVPKGLKQVSRAPLPPTREVWPCKEPECQSCGVVVLGGMGKRHSIALGGNREAAKEQDGRRLEGFR